MGLDYQKIKLFQKFELLLEIELLGNFQNNIIFLLNEAFSYYIGYPVEYAKIQYPLIYTHVFEEVLFDYASMKESSSKIKDTLTKDAYKLDKMMKKKSLIFLAK